MVFRIKVLCGANGLAKKVHCIRGIRWIVKHYSGLGFLLLINKGHARPPDSQANRKAELDIDRLLSEHVDWHLAE